MFAGCIHLPSDIADARIGEVEMENNEAKEATLEERDMQENQEIQKVLFIGNSYTYYNDMPQVLFAGLAKEAGFPVEVYSATKGGAKLIWYTDPTKEHYKILADAVEGKSFDWIILQEQSLTPITDVAVFHEGIEALMQLFDGRSKNFLLYATWGRKEGSQKLEDLNLSSQEMTDQLAKAYEIAGEKYGIPVVHVGKVFADYRKQNPEEELYDPDLSHPSLAGSLLAAQEILDVMLKKDSHNRETGT